LDYFQVINLFFDSFDEIRVQRYRRFMKNIIVEEYNPLWKVEFKKSKTFYEKVLKNIKVEIVKYRKYIHINLYYGAPLLPVNSKNILINCINLKMEENEI
jgi:hypothetical protein